MGQNADIVRRGFEHFIATGDLLEEIMAPDFVWDMSHYSGWPEQQAYAGIDGSRAFLRDWTEAWDDWRLEVGEIHEAGDQVLVMLHQTGRSKATGMPLEMIFSMVFTLRDGLEVRMEMYSDPTEARRTTALS